LIFYCIATFAVYAIPPYCNITLNEMRRHHVYRSIDLIWDDNVAVLSSNATPIGYIPLCCPRGKIELCCDVFPVECYDGFIPNPIKWVDINIRHDYCIKENKTSLH